MKQKQRVIFICTHNSSRSQMAEGLLRHLAGDRYAVFSAGTVATKVNPLAIKAMAEKGIDISHHTSDHIDKYMGMEFDYVITVCDHAKRAAPISLPTRRNGIGASQTLQQRREPKKKEWPRFGRYAIKSRKSFKTCSFLLQTIGKSEFL